MAARCCDGGIQYFCCGGVIRDLPLNDCVRDSLYKDEVCCGDMRISAEFVSCCAEKIPYSRRTEQCCGTFVGMSSRRRLFTSCQALAAFSL